ncbi:hypothetical protein TI39_contig5856g00004 [Zymoseptoria brevis]|uniref:Integrase catalytic domain-containing protein n=1 Tax=Zymoseptoria brevis TaxID=1047168 RepID=A0A0F4G4Y2_9PEZI|nr:hypothetical protein TI39_contig5856g00004 [Zymoseptoria brevis]
MTYTDNGSHFYGIFEEVVKSKGVKVLYGPVSHPQSTGLAEAYVRLLLKSMRSILQLDPTQLWKWPEKVQKAVFPISTRWVRHAGFHPCELLYGCTPHHLGAELGPEDQVRMQSILDQMKTDPSQLLSASTAEEHHAGRLARLDEIRTATLDQRLQYQMKLAAEDEKAQPEVPPERSETVHPGLERPMEGNYRHKSCDTTEAKRGSQPAPQVQEAQQGASGTRLARATQP